MKILLSDVYLFFYREYEDVYKTTGIDIDGRREITQKLSPCFESTILHITDWVKLVPGFLCMPLSDQTKLLRSMEKYRYCEAFV